MILYFADRRMEILGQASTTLPGGFTILEDQRVEDVETGVSSFSCRIGFDNNSRAAIENMTCSGNYILKKDGDKNEFYTIIDSDCDTKNQDVYIYAEDAGLDLINEIVGDFEAEDSHGSDWYINKYIADSGFVIGINEIPSSTTRKLKWEGEESVTSRLASIATQFGGYEISYRFDIDGLTIKNRFVDILKNRGVDEGVTLYLNRDIDKIVTARSIANLATAFLCEGAVPEETDDSESENNPITFTSEKYTYDDGDFYVDGDLLKSRKANEKWSRYLWKNEPNQVEGGEGYIVRPYSYNTESASTLCSHAIAELKKVCDMEVNYEIDLKKLPENVKIGDRINIVDDAGGLYVSTRVIMLEVSEVDRKHRATLGEHIIKRSGISEKVEAMATEFARTAVSVEKAQKAAKKALGMANDAKDQADKAISDAADALEEAKEAMGAADTATASVSDAAAKALAAEAAVSKVESSVSSIVTTVENAEKAIEEVKGTVKTADDKAEEAKTAAANAQSAASTAQTAADSATTAASTAQTAASAASELATTAKSSADDAITTANAAKLDAAAAKKDVQDWAESELETFRQTISAEYARTTDLTTSTASLQAQITANANQLSIEHEMIVVIDETANDAADKADAAQADAEAAQAAAEAAQADADKAQEAADAAQDEADKANAALETAQEALEQAQSDLDTAKADLATVSGRVDATEEDIAAAEEAVAAAQAAVNQAAADVIVATEKAEAAQETADTAVENAQASQTAANAAASAASTAQSTADAAASAASTAQGTANAAASAASSAQSTANAAASAASAAQSTADAAAAKAAEAEENLAAAEKTLEQAQSDLAAAEANLEAVAGRVDATEAEIEEAQEELDAAKKRLTKAEADVVTAQGAATAAASAATTAQGAADKAKAAADKAQTDADAAKDAADKAQAAVDNLAVRVSSNETEISKSNAQIALRATKTEVSAIQVGGRNMLRGSANGEGWVYDDFVIADREFIKKAATATEQFIYCNQAFDLVAKQEYTLSFKAKKNAYCTGVDVYILPETWANTGIAYYKSLTDLTAEYKDVALTFTAAATATSLERCILRIDNNGSNTSGSEAILYIKDVKLEKGNKATDWTYAPEDLLDPAVAAQEQAAEAIQAISNQAAEIAVLANMIATLVTDENGESLMTQTADGWTFSMKEKNEQISGLQEALKDLKTSAGSTKDIVDGLKQTLEDHGDTLEYVTITTYEDEPCIVLGESDSDFKLLITNTRIMFANGSNVPTHINTNGLVTKDIKVEGEIVQGGYSMINTPDGGWGLLWKGGVE